MKNLTISAWGAFSAFSTSYASVQAIITLILQWQKTADDVEIDLSESEIVLTASWSIEGQFRKAIYKFRNSDEYNAVTNIINEQ